MNDDPSSVFDANEDPNHPDAVAIRWQYHKEQERKHQEERRRLEDKMLALFNIADDLDGTKNCETNDLIVKIVGRLDRKVDADKVQELAAEHGLEDQLPSLFRWKPELNMKSWNNTSESVRAALAGAITTKPGRPSFSVIPKIERK